MSLAVILLPEAQTELDEAVDWYEQQQSGLGQDFADCIEEVFQRISHTPQIHQITWKDIRKAVVRRFPYIVLYREESQQIVVISVFHARRDPKIWQQRV